MPDLQVILIASVVLFGLFMLPFVTGVILSQLTGSLYGLWGRFWIGFAFGSLLSYIIMNIIKNIILNRMGIIGIPVVTG
jgi:hypothetical protein